MPTFIRCCEDLTNYCTLSFWQCLVHSSGSKDENHQFWGEWTKTVEITLVACFSKCKVHT